MTNTETIQAIRNEIEKRRDKYHYGSSTLHMRISKDFAELLSFLSTLESENQMNPEGVEEEIKRYFYDMGGDCRYAQTARHFAQWGAEHSATPAR